MQDNSSREIARKRNIKLEKNESYNNLTAKNSSNLFKLFSRFNCFVMVTPYE